MEKFIEFITKEKKKIMIGIAALVVIGLIILIFFPNPLGPNIRLITSVIRNTVIIALIAIIVLMVYRARKNKNIKKIATFFLSLLMVLVLLINVGVSSVYILANQLLDRNKITAEMIPEITEHAEKLTTEIESEGIVLLKNQNNALPTTAKGVNLFGYASGKIVYGGAGSGASDETNNVTLPLALQNAGFEVNHSLIEFYKSFVVESSGGSVLEMLGGNNDIPEVDVTEYSDTLLDEAVAFSDTALITISRNGGEGADMPLDTADIIGGTAGEHYLQLTKNEIAMIEMVEETFDNVIVLVNSSTPMNLGFLESTGIDAALWIGGPGSTGLDAVGQILRGDTTPSGRLPDIYAYDVTSSPAFFNTGSFSYLGSEHQASGLGALMSPSDELPLHHFNNYAEGIYVGYRYYETAAADGFIQYNNVVQYPFGYGLSYTSFNQTMGELKIADDTISVDVTVTNTGTTAGKEVVQIYHTAPYTKGGIEKSHVELSGFEKTKRLNPGESQTVTVEIPVEYLTSYDYKQAKGYVLETGNYEIKLMKNSHDVIDSKTYTVNETTSGRTTDILEATNQFEDAEGDVAYISRADWQGTMPKEKTKDVEITPEVFEAMEDTSVEIDENAEDIIFKNNGLTLADMKGLPYDDPQWELLLQQLSVSDMEALIGSGGWQTVRVGSVGKPQVSDIDGPAGLNGLINGTTGNQYTSAVIVAATWNKELAEEFGETLGEEARAKGVAGVYAPAMNIHRTPFSGRNFEYYSEDPVLSGIMGASMVKGLNKTNTYGYIKHFALDDQETNTVGMAVWSNEQAIRELYLRPFEITVKDGDATAVMSAWNRIGTTWTGNSDALLNKALRDEWGFTGLVITDNAMLGSYMDPDQAINSGNDMMLNSMASKFDTANTAHGRQNMRTASHNILYVVANSNALELVRVGIPAWIWILIIFDTAMLSLITFLAIKVTNVKKPKKNKKAKTKEAI